MKVCISQQKFTPSRYRPKFNALLQAWTIDLLFGRCASVRMIVEETGMSTPVIRGYIRALRAKGILRIVGYEPDTIGRPVVAVYTLSRESDCEKGLPWRVLPDNRLTLRESTTQGITTCTQAG